MVRLTPRATRTSPLFPYTTLFLSPLRETIGEIHAQEPIRRARRVQDSAHHRRRSPQRLLAEDCRAAFQRSEEHTSELQSLMRTSYAVFCLLKNIHHTAHIYLY